MSGELEVRKGDVPINTINQPGALVGEVSVLLGAHHTATVAATQPSRLRIAADGQSLLLGDPTIAGLPLPSAWRSGSTSSIRIWSI